MLKKIFYKPENIVRFAHNYGKVNINIFLRIMKKTFIYLASAILMTGILSSCNPLKKMVDNAGTVTYKSNPNPLEMHAGKVPINVTVTFPPKYFGKKVMLVITPALKAVDGSDEVIFKTQTVIGESYKDNYTRISNKEGGSFSFKDTIAYKNSLRRSDLELRFQVSSQKGEKASILTVKVADGIITTPELVQGGMLIDCGSNAGQTISMPVTKPEIATDKKEAKIFYDLQKADVKAKELKKADIDTLVSFIKRASADPNKQLKGVRIASYASPDGPEKLNADLVVNRGKNSQKAFMDILKKDKITKADAKDFYTTETTPAEDWDGFKAEVTASTIKDKELILRVLSMYQDPEVREKEIKKMAAAYNELRKDILPMLRRSHISFEYQSQAKTDADFVQIAMTTPEKLQQQELLYAGFITKDLNQKEQIYKSYVKAYPTDWTGYQNLGVCQVNQAKYSDAKANFQKVISLQATNADALNNLGVISAAQGNDKEAFDYFSKAIAAGCKSPAVGYNMGVILIKRAQYKDAVAKFTQNSFNKALAETLSGDNTSATSTLNAMGNSDKALFYYLKAVVAAKSTKDGDVIENLKIAVAKDNNLKDYAKKDLEFRKYFDKPEFKSVVE